MPARPTAILPDGWQIVRRLEGFYLQRRLPGTEFWIDVYGPTQQRGAAVRAFERRQHRRQDTSSSVTSAS